MECLQNLDEIIHTIPYSNWRNLQFDFKILPNKFPFTNTRLPYWASKSRYHSESWESRVTQKRFIELFNIYDTALRQISIVDINKNLQFYCIGAGFVFRKINETEQIPIIVRCNEGIFVSSNLTEFEIKLLKKINIEYLVKDFILEDLIVHHKFRFTSLRERSEYLGEVMDNLARLKEGEPLLSNGSIGIIEETPW